jgi:hypothetical protein
MSELPSRKETALLRNEVRTLLENFRGKTEIIYRTQFFIDRLDLTVVALPYLGTTHRSAGHSKFTGLLEVIQDEFEEFVILESPDASLDSVDKRTISCEKCTQSYSETLDTCCPHCGHTSIFQIAELNSSTLASNLGRYHEDDPFIQCVLSSTRQHTAQSSCVRLITIYETFCRSLNDYLQGPKPKRRNLFQNVADGQKWFIDHHNFDLLDDISAKEVKSFKLFAIKRNVFGHQSSGLADETYLYRKTEIVGELINFEEELNKPVSITIDEVEVNIKRVQRVIAHARQHFLA